VRALLEGRAAGPLQCRSVSGSGAAGAPLRSVAWAIDTRGALSDLQRRQLRSAVLSAYMATARGLLTALFRARLTGDAPTAPDSRLARTARDAALDQGPALCGHGHRTWLAGYALARADGASVDPELFYVAALLHDAGLADEVVGEDFTLRSARIVLDACARGGLGTAEATRLADSVVAHTTPGLSAEQDLIGFYVQVGALADLAGLRQWDLPRGYLRAAYRDHPSCGVHAEVRHLIAREARDVPRGRFELLQRFGLARLVQLSPTRRY
jgi:hypothetical protein